MQFPSNGAGSCRGFLYPLSYESSPPGKQSRLRLLLNLFNYPLLKCSFQQRDRQIIDEKKLKALAAELTKGMTPREIVATFEKMEYADPKLAVSRFILKLGDHLSDHL